MADSTKTRMSPLAQNGGRAQLENELANAMTGVPEVDSLLANEVRRKFLFSGPGRAPGLPPGPVQPQPTLWDRLVQMFHGKVQ